VYVEVAVEAFAVTVTVLMDQEVIVNGKEQVGMGPAVVVTLRAWRNSRGEAAATAARATTGMNEYMMMMLNECGVV
jgi:hypothetical protein